MSAIGWVVIGFLALYGAAMVAMAIYLGLPLIRERLKRRKVKK